MRIGFVIGRIGGIDGVALETEKWIEVLTRLGHEVFVLTGALEGEVEDISLLPELAFDHPNTVEEQEVAFLGRAGDGVMLEALIETGAELIAHGITEWVEDWGIDCLVPENACALPCHLQMGLGIARAVERTGVIAVTHDHDFWWEREGRYDAAFPFVEQMVAEHFPLVRPGIRHAVINTAARTTLAERYGVDATVVPNVMDFEAPFAVCDDYNVSLREDLGLTADDRLLFQITRSVRRKGIETAIELVERLADPRVKLVITGTATDDSDHYLADLLAMVARLDLGDRIRFAGDRFDNQRRRDATDRKVYSLADAYAHADACTYFSTYEGFGNAFVEAVLARVPVFVNDYEPVYTPDIGSKGFRTVQIRGGELTDAAVGQIRTLLDDPAERAAIADHNFALGREHFSYEALAAILGPLFDDVMAR